MLTPTTSRAAIRFAPLVALLLRTTRPLILIVAAFAVGLTACSTLAVTGPQLSDDLVVDDRVDVTDARRGPSPLPRWRPDPTGTAPAPITRPLRTATRPGGRHPGRARPVPER
jgi:hypothetical protein